MSRIISMTVVQLIVILVLSIGLLSACRSKKVMAGKHPLGIDMAMLDSIKKVSDSTYTKPYFTRDFVTATYFVNKKDSSLTQLMKDKDSVIRQVIVTKNKIRILTAQYYGNGQLMAKYKLDEFGQYNGYSEEYYESGYVKRSGMYRSGLHTGKWKNFTEKGVLTSTDEYNSDGNVIGTTNNE